jgi:hypothetical protein
LANSEPGNPGWQHDLAASHWALADDALLKAGRTAEARRHLGAGRDISATLVTRYPDWAQWRQNLADSTASSPRSGLSLAVHF